MSNPWRGSAGIGVLRRAVPALTLLAALAPPVAQAQVNIDQDKTPAHIYASACAVCHKSIRGLAHGRGQIVLARYLAEHYTSSDSEAAALAAYVLAGGGGLRSPAPARDALTGPERPAGTAQMPVGREQRRSQNRQQARERARKQSPEARQPAAPQEKPAATAPPSDAGPPTAAAAPTTPASRPTEPPAAAAPATAQPGDASSGASDNIAD